MKLNDVGIRYPELKPFLKNFKITSLYPTQSEAIEKGAIEKSFLLASGTASGKTLVAQLATIKKVVEGKKILYLAPLRSLAFEKFEEFKTFPFKVAISIGDMDSNDPWLKNFDIIVATYEKAESLIRHKPNWLKDIGLVVFDEAHELARKPLIETLAIKFKQTQILFLSATIGNVPEIAAWLGVDYLKSEFRPVPLKEGVLKGTEILWKDESKQDLNSQTFGIEGLIQDGVNSQKQTLIFNNTRREAESTAKKATKFVKNLNNKKLNEIADKVEHSLNTPTKQCKKLASLVRKGVAFHHAGLMNKQRILIENAFRDGFLPVLSSTVTLVAGINLPSRRVIIKSPHFMGEPWPVSLYKQASGRSGRPGFDKEGESIILHKNPDFAFDYYINGVAENLVSPLAKESTLRKEIIGLFASGFAYSRLDLERFMKQTFYAHQHGNAERIIDMGHKVLNKLIDWKLLEKKKILKTTKLGQRVAQLYIDPMTAVEWLKNFESSSEFGYIHLIGMGNEMYLPRLKASDSEDMMYSLSSRIDELIYPQINSWDIDYERYIRSLKLALIIEDWINEKSEDYILERFGIAPGDLRNYIRNTEWLVYALSEIVKITKGKNRDLNILSKRIKHGVRREIVELAELPGIGRVRARKLWRNDITAQNIKQINDNLLIKLIGQNTTERVKKFLKKV